MMFIYSLFIVLLVVLFGLGAPVAVAIGVTPVVIMFILEGGVEINYSVIGQQMMYGLDSFILIAIPFFMLAGRLMNEGGVTEEIFAFARALVGHFKGGLGHVNVVASLVFSGITGAAASDVAGLGRMEIKAMEDGGYETTVASAITGASATVGPIIPPSIPLVVYGVLSGVPVGHLLIGGLLPGVVTGLGCMAMTAYFAHTRDYPRDVKLTMKQRLKIFIKAIPALLAPIILIGGIFSGQFTPTEAAAVAVVYALIYGFVSGSLNLKKTWGIFKTTAVESAVIGFIISAASLYGWYLTRLRIPYILVEALLEITQETWLIILLLNIAILIIGCFIETIAALTILVPLLTPLFPELGINPLHFGVVMVFNLMIGLLTPPFGINLYILNTITDIKIERLFKAVLPWLGMLLFVLLILNLFPEIVTYIPTNFM